MVYQNSLPTAIAPFSPTPQTPQSYTEPWIYQGFEYASPRVIQKPENTRILNMPQVLNIWEYWIC